MKNLPCKAMSERDFFCLSIYEMLKYVDSLVLLKAAFVICEQVKDMQIILHIHVDISTFDVHWPDTF